MTKSKKLKAKVTICRPSSGEIKISVEDELSGRQFLEIEMEPSDFAKCVTGVSYVPAVIEVRELQNVGKKRTVEKRVVECPLVGYDRDAFRNWLVENAQEVGWTLNTYLGSQGSVTGVEGGTRLRYSVYKYVDVE